MKRLTFNAAMEQFHERFPRIAVAEDEPQISDLPELQDGPMPWDDEEAEDAG